MPPKKAAASKAAPKVAAASKAAPKVAAPKKAAPKVAAAKTTNASTPPPAAAPAASAPTSSSTSAGRGTKSAADRVIKKGKGVVDPYFADAAKCRVLEDGGVVYQCTLNQTNVGQNNNKFYVIQLLQDETCQKFHVFTRWGRVGVPGQQSTETHQQMMAAKTSFCSKFQDKTRNQFGTTNFIKVPGKYQLMDIDYGTDDDDEEEDDGPAKKKAKSESAAPVPSKLPSETQDLIHMISSVTAMSNTLRELSIDTKRMPLGKISKEQIKNAYGALKRIETELAKKKPSVEQATSDFYTLIPHDFGFQRPPLINTVDMLKEKMEMLDALAQLEVSSTLLSRDKAQEENVLDKTYAALNCDLTPLQRSHAEFKRVEEYARNTTGSTHNYYTLHVEQVFKVQRHGESARYEQKCKSIGNRQMLWHGSRTTNFVGILSQGLRIAPKEAPVTGYMFGKGIYLADTCTKSANYCCTSRTNTNGLMLLCEAALGKQKEYVSSCYMEEAQPGFDSTKGLGRMHPDPAGAEQVGKVLWPKGKMITDTGSLHLLYPEYIVYDVAQCQIQYLVKMRFDYK
ncbi:Poly(ADP-ribose) polymerase-like protein [Novymonas esmeraldas]|uniref:Poly [ADP-ribose] polymerase n=1 Tax=Novymonas esmeraldas TaxID=1808958 RepID=A0AAW0EW14_9TRYP